MQLELKRRSIKEMDEKISEVVFLLLGNNSTIPYSECTSILDSHEIPFKEVARLDQILILLAPAKAGPVVTGQAGMVRRSGILLAQTPSTTSSILQIVRGVDLDQILEPGMSFAVRVKGIKEYSKGINLTELERELGAQIKDRVKQARVDLEHPDALFFLAITNDKALFCLGMSKADERGFNERRPTFRPFFHPTSMHPRLARAMVNLSGARRGRQFLDPFCGSGGIVIEAGIVGCKTVGIDIDLQMVRGCRRNLRSLGLDHDGICLGDARHLPFKQVQSLATDPPYGRSSSTKGNETSALIDEFLAETSSLLEPGKRICLSIPSNVDMEALIFSGLKLLEKHSFRVHRSLTRRIAVFSRT